MSASGTEAESRCHARAARRLFLRGSRAARRMAVDGVACAVCARGRNIWCRRPVPSDDVDPATTLFYIADDYHRLSERVKASRQTQRARRVSRIRVVGTSSPTCVMLGGSNERFGATSNFVTYRSKRNVTETYLGHHHVSTVCRRTAPSGFSRRGRFSTPTTFTTRARSASLFSEGAIMAVDFRYRRLGLRRVERHRTGAFDALLSRTILGLAPAGEAPAGEALFRCSARHHDVVLHQGPQAGLRRIGWEMESAHDAREDPRAPGEAAASALRCRPTRSAPRSGSRVRSE